MYEWVREVVEDCRESWERQTRFGKVFWPIVVLTFGALHGYMIYGVTRPKPTEADLQVGINSRSSEKLLEYVLLCAELDTGPGVRYKEQIDILRRAGISTQLVMEGETHTMVRNLSREQLERVLLTHRRDHCVRTLLNPGEHTSE